MEKPWALQAICSISYVHQGAAAHFCDSNQSLNFIWTSTKWLWLHLSASSYNSISQQNN